MSKVDLDVLNDMIEDTYIDIVKPPITKDVVDKVNLFAREQTAVGELEIVSADLPDDEVWKKQLAKESLIKRKAQTGLLNKWGSAMGNDTKYSEKISGGK